MAIAKTRTFRSGNSEAVRLPKDAAFGEGGEDQIVAYALHVPIAWL